MSIHAVVKRAGVELVDEFAKNGGPLETSARTAPRLLAQLAADIEHIEPVRTHAVMWLPTRWMNGINRRARHESWPPQFQQVLQDAVSWATQLSTTNNGQYLLRRGHLLGLYDIDPVFLFVGVMAWGTGTTGYGWWRTADIATQARNVTALRDRLRSQIGAARSPTTPVDKARAAWNAWRRGPSKLDRFDTAFASKLAYFAAGDPEKGTGPLIADRRTAWAAWAFSEDLADTRTRRDRYTRYVGRLTSWASDAHLRPDSLERALFELGPWVFANGGS